MKDIEFKMYIYLDNEGIESLYSQTVERIETAYTLSEEKGSSGKLTGKLGFGKILSILGLVDVSAETEISGSSKISEMITSHMTVEQKLSALISYVNDLYKEQYFNDTIQAIEQCKISGQKVFVNINEKFNLPQFYKFSNACEAINVVNNAQTIFFEIGQPIFNKNKQYDEYDYSDNYFKKTKSNSTPRILMSASLSKCPRSNRGMSLTGHDAVLFRGYNGIKVPLSVFGLLYPIEGGILYQLKPYAIWF